MTDYERFGDYQPAETGRTLGVALTFLFVGMGVGALTALMLAPQAGRKTRRDLRRRYEDAMERVNDLTDQGRDAWQKGSGWTRERVDWTRGKVAPIGKWARKAAQR